MRHIKGSFLVDGKSYITKNDIENQVEVVKQTLKRKIELYQIVGFGYKLTDDGRTVITGTGREIYAYMCGLLDGGF